MSKSRWWESLSQDLGFALRTLRKSPAFTLIAGLSLALGLGANTAIFSLISALILRPLPVPNPGSLVAVGDPSRVDSMSIGSVRPDLFSYPMYRLFRGQGRSFDGLLAAGRTGRLTLGPADEAVGSPRGRMVSGNYFDVLGVRAARGRTLTPDDEGAPGASPQVMISHGFWQRGFAADPEILGRSLELNGTAFSIVGVTPPGFAGEVVGQAIDVWIPISMQAAIHRGRPNLDRWEAGWLQLIGRLRPGTSLVEARGEIAGLYRRTLDSLADGAIDADFINDRLAPEVAVTPGAYGLSRLRAQFSRSLFTLMAIVGLVLLVACANVANLLLERATGRRKEIVVRLALGAGRGRLVRQLLAESFLLCVLGAGLGLLFAAWAAEALVALVGASSVALSPRPDGPVLAFTLLLTLGTTVLFGLAPAFSATRVALAPVLREGGRGLAAGRSRAGRLLVVTQLAFSLLLLVGSGLFVRTLQNLEKLDLGFDREGILMLNVDPVGAGLPAENLEPFTAGLLGRLAELPGVSGVTASENGIFSGTESSATARPEGFTPADGRDPEIRFDHVAPRYFSVVGVPLLAGRDFTAADRQGASPVTVINAALAETYFPGVNPVGRHVTAVGPPDEVFEIVGVAANARDHDLRGPVPPRFYLPMLQADGFPSQYNVEIRTERPAALVAAVRQAVRELHPGMVIDDLDPLTAMIADSIGEERMIARLSSVFSLLALVLASIGLYGVISYAVARRTQELGVRLALGANHGTILWLVLRETLLLAAAGIAIGVPAALAATRLIESRLVGLSAADPLTLIVAAATLVAVAVAAGAFPSLRATRVDPVRALKWE